MPSHGSTLWPTQQKVVIFFCWPFWQIYKSKLKVMPFKDCTSSQNLTYMPIQYTIANGDALTKNDLCGSCMPKVNGVHKCPFVIRTFVKRASPAVVLAM
jgi:hypothetical protein